MEGREGVKKLGNLNRPLTVKKQEKAFMKQKVSPKGLGINGFTGQFFQTLKG